MSRAIALVFAALALLVFPAAAAQAQSGARVVATVSWVEEWDSVRGEWVPVAGSAAEVAPMAASAHPASTIITETVAEEPVRYIAAPARPVVGETQAGAGLARFGPFVVLDDRRAALIASTDAASPTAFAAMLAAHPGLDVIEFADAPGTSHDLANLRLGRAIRAAGLATHVPAGGSARSGAVELFLAGTRRTMDPGALFAVHSWRDEAGREPADFAPDAPENRLYLDYYSEMGMSADEARAFYAMTNSVPHAGALWLEGTQMARWIVPQAAPRSPAVRALPPVLAAELRRALTRSGAVLAAAARAPWLVPAPAPRIAYRDWSAGLLDSAAAFP